MFKLSSSGPCETLRAHWIPGENPGGKSRDLPNPNPKQLSERTEGLHFLLYFLSNTLYKHHTHNNLLRSWQTQVTK